jgi:hypothetical protein
MRTITRRQALSREVRAEMLELGLLHTPRCYGLALVLSLGVLDVTIVVISLLSG